MIQFDPPFFRIHSADEQDFYSILAQVTPHNTCFEYHWPYIIQATRGRGYVYKADKSRIYFYVRNFADLNELIVVKMIGNCMLGLACLQKYASAPKYKLIIKNVPQEDLDYWKALGYCQKQSPWSNYSLSDDNSYPECIYTLEALALMHCKLKPGQVRMCRASYAQEIRKYLRFRRICVAPYDPTLHKNTVYRLLIENAEFLQNKGIDSRENVIDAHKFVFIDTLLHTVRLVHLENDTIVGFNYLTVINNTIFGNALIHKNESHLMSYCMWQGFYHLYCTFDKSTLYFVTLQGSETAGQYYWKQGFAPIKEISKIHVEWKPST